MLILDVLVTLLVIERGWDLWKTAHPPVPLVPEVSVIDAIRGAFEDCGLDPEKCVPTFDLVQSGKFHEVLYHASNRVGNPLCTVKDLSDLLS